MQDARALAECAILPPGNGGSEALGRYCPNCGSVTDLGSWKLAARHQPITNLNRFSRHLETGQHFETFKRVQGMISL
jgi:hypothetical protein